MFFWHTLMESIKLPSKKALFKLNRTGMDIVVIYIFFLLLIASVPSLIDQLTATNNLSINKFFTVIFFLIFHFLPMTIIFFFFLSLLAFICLGISKLMKRKLRYSILWKMSAYVTTVPLLIYTIITLLFPISDVFLLISLLYTLILLIKMISIYPKRRVRPKKQTKSI